MARWSVNAASCFATDRYRIRPAAVVWQTGALRSNFAFARNYSNFLLVGNGYCSNCRGFSVDVPNDLGSLSASQSAVVASCPNLGCFGVENFLASAIAFSLARGVSRDSFGVCTSFGGIWSHLDASGEYPWADPDDLYGDFFRCGARRYITGSYLGGVGDGDRADRGGGLKSKLAIALQKLRERICSVRNVELTYLAGHAAVVVEVTASIEG